MNLSTRIALTGIWLLIAANVLSAQIGFSLPVVNNAAPGSTIYVPVATQGFTAIAAAQFVLRWDPAVLEFDTVSNYNLAGLDSLDFGISETLDSGMLRMAWTAPSFTTGATVADGTPIFTLKFKVIGANNTGTELTITEQIPTTYFEIVPAQGQPIGLNGVVLDQGFLAVGYTVGTRMPNLHTIDFQIAPNPAVERAQGRFVLPEAATVHLTVTDGAGRIVDTQALPLSAGQHGIELPLGSLRTKGLYYLLLRTAHGQQLRSFLLH